MWTFLELLDTTHDITNTVSSMIKVANFIFMTISLESF